MTTRFKDFGAPEATHEPLSFALFGETFNCIPSLPGKFLLDLVAQANSDDPAASASIVSQFFNTVLVEESRDRFNVLAMDPNRVVPVETLSEITAWLVEEYSARPTEQPENSSLGQ